MDALKQGFAEQNHALLLLVQAQQRTAAVQTETLRRILALLTEVHAAVTEPAPPSQVPDLLATIIALLRDQDIVLRRIEQSVSRAR